MAFKNPEKFGAQINGWKLAPGTLKVGFLEGATYPDGTSVPFVAAMNEFGVPSHGQPPRPFFRRAIQANKDKWGKAAAMILKATNGDVPKTLALLGEGIKGDIVQSINDLVAPPLAQSTIDRKGFDKPLIEHAIMINSVGVEVNNVKAVNTAPTIAASTYSGKK
jgi:hypothetical protein